MMAVAVVACSYEAALTGMAEVVEVEVEIDHLQGMGKDGLEIEA